MSAPVMKLDRRAFLRAGLGGSAALVLGLRIDGAAAGTADDTAAANGATATLAPNAFVRIGTDDTVTIITKHIEFGQGTHTGLPTILAEELDADWTTVRIEAAPVDVSRYANIAWGKVQGTGGSSSIFNSWQQLRQAGASARAMLVAAAAKRWQVPADEITVTKGVVSHAASGRTARFGELAAAAARESVPATVTLKDPAQFTLIGSHIPRTDRLAKTTGRALYTQDMQLPDMLTAVVAHPPRFGGRPGKVDDTKARAVKGVVAVLPVASGVAVVAENFWAAKKGRDALAVTWDDSAAVRVDSAALAAEYRALAEKPGRSVGARGASEPAFASAAKTLSAAYEFPYLAHASMEPLNCVVQLKAGRCELWYGAQSMSSDQQNVARLLGLEPEAVTIHQLYAGGSFGRRADPRADYVIEAVSIAQALKSERPVKLVWTREDDMRGGRYRPAALHTVNAAFDEQGQLTGWRQRIVVQSLVAGTPMAPKDSDRVENSVHEGASDLAYAVPNLDVDVHLPTPGVPVLWWRSVGHTHTAYAAECFIDELAHAAGKDPLEYRRALLAHDARRLAVLNLAAGKSGWGTPLANGRGRGIAVHKSFRTLVAEVVEVTMKDGGAFTVDRVVVAVDCGIAVNPDIVRAQMESCVGYGLGAALTGAITLEDGVVQQDNFDTYTVLRHAQMPTVEVHIVPSQEPPTGVGEPGVPPLAPALANALFAATGKRYRRLPLSLGPDAA